MTYFEKLQDPRWQKKRLQIMERDGFACRDCEATNKTLHVHHCHYGKCEPWETSNFLLLTLCSDCHETRQVAEDECRAILGGLLACSTIDEIDQVASALNIIHSSRPHRIVLLVLAKDSPAHKALEAFHYARAQILP